MCRYFNPTSYKWDGDNADFTPESDDIPWSFVPEKKVTIEDVRYLLGSYYQGTKYNPYSHYEDKGKYRSIGVPNSDVVGIIQIRDYVEDEIRRGVRKKKRIKKKKSLVRTQSMCLMSIRLKLLPAFELQIVQYL